MKKSSPRVAFGLATGLLAAVSSQAVASNAPPRDPLNFLFGTNMQPSRGTLEIWEKALPRIEEQTAHLIACVRDSKGCSHQEAGVKAFIEEGKAHHPDRVGWITAVDKVVNMFPYKTDKELYHVKSYWAGVNEFLNNGGDCNGNALAKREILAAAGVPRDDMRMAVVRKKDTGEAHAVLAVRDEDRVYILDNDPRQAPAPQENKTGYELAYAMDGKNKIWTPSIMPYTSRIEP